MFCSDRRRRRLPAARHETMTGKAAVRATEPLEAAAFVTPRCVRADQSRATPADTLHGQEPPSWRVAATSADGCV